jgi:hypothetical protein
MEIYFRDGAFTRPALYIAERLAAPAPAWAAPGAGAALAAALEAHGVARGGRAPRRAVLDAVVDNDPDALMSAFQLAQALTSLGEQRKAYAVAGAAMLRARALGWGYTEGRLALEAASALIHGARGPTF